MFQVPALRFANVHRGLILGLSLSAVAGWGSFAVARHSSTEVERQLRDQIASLQQKQAQLLAERTKAQVALSEMAQLRAELGAARGEINRLSQPHQVQAELPPVRPDASGRSLRINEAGDDVSKIGSIGKTSTSEQDKAASAKLRQKQTRSEQNGAVRIAAQGAQKAAEKPRSDKAPTVVSELDTAALRQLTKSAGVPAR
ncbi:hypothetical protein AA309_24515 [Microvirga vignae]|uniref:Uncharacterized protein n=1 Tax=Microvirga vignae TaxID=1225564 RepID=A0A0H1R5X6_9HYPH|nr:hypothetical protein AA309_24515 [Microvirga vignae]